MVATVKQSQPKDLNLDDAPAKQCDVFLVDGNGLAYRAFYALPEELQTVEGLPTNALLGLANMFMRMLMDYRPRTVLVAWDSKPTGRLEIAADYKAHRKPMPDLLRQQQPWFEPVVEAFGYRNLKVEGKEADDIIGTLARMAEDAGHKVCVVSTDRDAFQLASDNVCIMMTPRGVQDVVVYTPERIIQRYGIGPDVIPDFIGLKGDTSDNIAGVPGIGDKTAAELLIQFGSMEGVYANLDAVSGTKRRQSLADAAKDAADSKRLATIDREIPLDVDFDALVVAPPDRSTMKELFRTLEFRALLKRVDELEEALPGAPPSEPSDSVEIAWREGGVEELRSLGSEVGLAAAGDRLAASDGESAVVVTAPAARVIEALRGTRVITHGLKHPALEPAGDTAIAAYLLDPGRSGYEIDDLAEESGVAVQVGADEETATLVRGAAAARRLHPGLYSKLADRDLIGLYESIELPLIPVLGAMEAVGIRVDTYRLAEIAAKLADQVEELEARCHELAGGPFVIGSPKQLGEVLFERLGLPADRKGKTGYSTDARVLAKIRELHPIVDVVEQWREQSKLLNTYLAAAARPDRSGRRAPAHDVQPDDRRHRPALVDPPQPAEHPHPHGARARDPKRVRRRRRLQAALGRLLAGRAADPRPPLRGARAQGRLRARRGHPPGHGGRGAGQAARDAHPRRAQPGQGRELRHHLRDQLVRALGAARHLARGGAGLHRHVSGPVPACERVHRAHDRVGEGAAAT